MKREVNENSKKKKPHISVVIPAYNEEKYLPECLSAINDQNYPRERYEIIVANNNSTDKTAEIAKKMGARVVFEKRQGHVFALNKGMHSAIGDIIAVTDADTLVKKNWLSTISKVFEDKEVVAATGSVLFTSQSKVAKYLGEKAFYLFIRFHFAINKPHLSGPNLSVRRNVFLNIKGLDTRYETFGDLELGLRIKNSGKVAFCKELAVSTSPRRMEKGSFEDAYKYVNSYINTMWLKHPPKSVLTPRR